MALYRRTADRIIDQAHCAIANAEMMLLHSYTDEHFAKHNAELARAQDFLRRAVAARDAWDASEHDDYEAYPDVPETTLAT